MTGLLRACRDDFQDLGLTVWGVLVFLGSKFQGLGLACVCVCASLSVCLLLVCLLFVLNVFGLLGKVGSSVAGLDGV